MAILYGTTADGTTLPVLVDQFGNLLAKGIDGEPGTPGEDGAPGPPGPPGVGQLPPNPYEGALLGWQDGDLAWLGASVVLPAGTYGPYEYSNNEGFLTVPQDVSNLYTGQQLYMSNEKGESLTVIVETEKIANVFNNVLSFNTSKGFSDFFEGEEVQPGVVITDIDDGNSRITVSGGSWYAMDGTTSGIPEGVGDWNASDANWRWIVNGTERDVSQIQYRERLFNAQTDSPTAPGGNPGFIRYIFTPPLQQYNQVELYGDAWYDPYANRDIKWKGTNSSEKGMHSIWGNSSAVWRDITGQFTGALEYVEFGNYGGEDGGRAPDGLAMIRVDGRTLTLMDDFSAAQSQIRLEKSGAGSVSMVSGNTIVMRNNNRQWVKDLYVTAPEQRISARAVARKSAIKKTQ